MFVKEQASQVRKEWSAFIDRVLHEKPAMIKRNRDQIAALSLDHLKTLLSSVKFTVSYLHEEDASWTAILSNFDLVVNAKTKKEALEDLAQDLIEYANEYMDEFDQYYRSTNRKQHFPYVVKVLIQKDLKAVMELLDA